MPHDADTHDRDDTGSDAIVDADTPRESSVLDRSAGDRVDAEADVRAGDRVDAEADAPHGLLPIDERNPVILDNDGWNDNWSGEYAVLLANAGGPALAGIVVDASNYWPDMAANKDGWTRLVTAARASGLQHIPDVTEGATKPLTPPNDGRIDSTLPIGSAGARLIVDVSRRLGSPGRPVVVLTGSQLTDVADAYLLDHTIVDRLVVVSQLGMYKPPRAIMSGPNGDLDPWADWIVAQRFRYIQISLDYNQANDVPAEDLPSLPKNALGDWIAAKQPNLSTLSTAADQLSVLAVGVPSFVATAQRCAPDTSAGFNSPAGQGPPLVPSSTGGAWMVTEVKVPLGRARFWEVLLDPHTFGP